MEHLLALLKELNDEWRMEELSLTASENDPKAGSENHVLLTDGDSVWHFPDVEAAAQAVVLAMDAEDVCGAFRVLNEQEENAVVGWYVNAFGGGETYVGEQAQWPEVWKACGFNPEACEREYLQAMAPEDWVYPRLGSKREV